MPDPNIIDSRPIEDVLVELADEVPAEEWDRLPADLTDNLDHYLYGTPRVARTDTPNIPDIDVNKMIWSAAIVLACILAYGLVTILMAYFPPSRPAPADLLVGAGFLFPKG